LRILHLIYTDGISGAEKYLLELLPALQRIGIDCELACVCPQKNRSLLQSYCDQMGDRGVNTRLYTTRSKFSYPNICSQIAQYLRTQQITLVHSHLFSADFIAVCIKSWYLRNITLFSTKHGYQEEYLIQYGLGNKKNNHDLYYYIARFVIKNIDHNLTVSRALSRLYVHLQLGKEPMPFIHHGVHLAPSPSPLLSSSGDPKILMVGRLSVIKGHTYLIDALPKIIQRFPGLRLILVGEGPLKATLIQQAGDLGVLEHIDFVGFAKPGDFSSACQVMILPSLFESFGLVYIESFALKIPVIAFDAEAGNEIIENLQTGILVPKEDSTALAEQIIYLLDSPAERDRLVDNAYQKYLTYYNVERMAEETAAWYRRCLVGKQDL